MFRNISKHSKLLGLLSKTSKSGRKGFSGNKMENECSQKIKMSERLSTVVKPVNYRLRLNPDAGSGSFQGSVNILVYVAEERNYIILHSNFLEINSVKMSTGTSEIPVAKFSEIKHLEQLVIHFDRNVLPGKYNIEIDFNGSLVNKIVGFYASKLVNKRTMVASKFQPTYARQAFPCFDEPDFKATFDITLVKDPTHIALSNMNELSSVHDPATNKDIVTFNTSVPMSTYLACFVICDFESKEVVINTNGIGKPFILRSFAQRGETHKIDFAQDIGKRATEFYINYYEVPYPLPKLDMIAIPDYVSGATEHWGLVTYRETSFLLDPAAATAATRLRVANTIAHELAHMWFGNLVTMKWWDEVWLNEGFASYMQVKALHDIQPDWNMMAQFVVKSVHGALSIDARRASHPVVVAVEGPDQITAAFDVIAYSKGSSILRMLEGFVGEEGFRRGVSAYLRRHEFANTVTADFLAALQPYFLERHPGLDLAHIIATWTRQSGFPLLRVVRQGDDYVITQTRFLADPGQEDEDDHSPYDYKWFVPITFKTDQRAVTETVWFPDSAHSVRISLQPGERWLKLNSDQLGYYRVTYESQHWDQLAALVREQPDALTPSDLAQLVSDSFALSSASLLPYDTTLRLTQAICAAGSGAGGGAGGFQRSAAVWQAVSGAVGSLLRRMTDPQDYQLMQKYIRRLVQPAYDSVNWDDSSADVERGLFRSTVVRLSARAGGGAAGEARARLRAGGAAGHGLSDVIYYYGMQSATEAEWDELWQSYLQEPDAQEQLKMRSALAAPRDVNILKKYLSLSWESEAVRAQDYLSVVGAVAANPAGAGVAWAHVRASWPALVARYSLNSRYLGHLLPDVTASFDTDERLAEMESFFAQYPSAGAGAAARARALETVRGNRRWALAHRTYLRDWLTAQP